MHDAKPTILIVDDEVSIRNSLSVVLREFGHGVRCSADGFSALHEIRREIPDILLSDLNMPGMSGFELLSVVRRRFPVVQVIAMSGAFSGDEAPSGVAADAFFQKGCSMGTLLRIIESLPRPAPLRPSRPVKLAPIWIQSNGRNPSGEQCVTIPCPECLRTFSETPGVVAQLIYETSCVYCHSPIQYAIVKPVEPLTLFSFQLNQTTESPAIHCVPRTSQSTQQERA
jgi:CheY-like chemotaxis protein